MVLFVVHALSYVVNNSINYSSMCIPQCDTLTLQTKGIPEDTLMHIEVKCLLLFKFRLKLIGV